MTISYIERKKRSHFQNRHIYFDISFLYLDVQLNQNHEQTVLIVKIGKTFKLQTKSIRNKETFNEVVIGSHTDCILQQLVVILTTSNNSIGSQYDYQLNYYL